MNVGVARGSSALAELSGALDALNEETSAPIMARRPWLETWVSCYPDHEPWTIYVEGPRGLEAAALLARRRRRGVLEIVRMGHGATDHARLPSRDQRSARILAEAISLALEATRGPWRLFLGQLPVGDPVTKEIVATLPTAALVPSDGSPTVRLEQGGSIDEFLSRKMRSNLRTRMNRLQREGLSEEFSRGSAEPQRLRRCCRRRSGCGGRGMPSSDGAASSMIPGICRSGAWCWWNSPSGEKSS